MNSADPTGSAEIAQPRRPRLLDLFCRAGGASMGYWRAGFDVVGVDIEARPDYPFEFIEADALEVLDDRRFLDTFDAVAASPPCQRYSTMSGGARVNHPDLLPPTQAALRAWGGYYVIENVAGAARLLNAPVKLCGTAFGLGVWRHRFFESNAWLTGVQCSHHLLPRPIGVYGKEARPHDPPEGYIRPGTTQRRGVKPRSIEHAREVMGIEWMTDYFDLAESIPPAYTQYLGQQLIEQVEHDLLVSTGLSYSPGEAVDRG